MSDWVESPLAQVASFQKGRKVETSPFDGDGFAPYLGASGLEGGDDGFAATPLAVIAKNTDTLMLWDGERSGLVGFGRQGVVASTVSKLSPSDKIEPKYLYYALSEQFDWIQHRRTGTGVPHVPKDLGRLLKLRYPERRAVQQRIATILTAIDTAIEKTEALIAKYQQIKAGLMHDLFTRGVLPNGQLRPPREQAPELYQETAIGWIPRGWECFRLSKVADLFVGFAFKSECFEQEGVSLLRGENVGYGKPDWSDRQCLNPRDSGVFAAYLLHPGDIVIGMDRTFTKSGVKISRVSAGDCPALLVQRVGKFVAISCKPEYLRWLVLSADYLRRLAIQQKGMDIPHLSQSEILEPWVPVPHPDEQLFIAEKIQAHFNLLEKCTFDLQKLRQLKLGLMHDLLTGKVPVKVEEPEAVDG